MRARAAVLCLLGAVAGAALLARGGHERGGTLGSPFAGTTPSLVLPDDRGGTFDLAARLAADRAAGRAGIALVYFGYRGCPEVCPTTLADIAAALAKLGPAAARVSVIFVTLDPARDTPPALRDYLASFAPPRGASLTAAAFIGLVGDHAATADAARRWGVTVRQAEGGRYFDHTSVVTAVDGRGRARLRYGVGQIGDADGFARDLARLLGEERGPTASAAPVGTADAG